MMMLPRDMSDLSNFELIHMVFPKEMWEVQIVWLLGTFLGWVYMEAVLKGRLLTDVEGRGYLRYKFKESLRRRVPDIGYIPEFFQDQDIVFDNG